jgi:hypothetical protein
MITGGVRFILKLSGKKVARPPKRPHPKSTIMKKSRINLDVVAIPGKYYRFICCKSMPTAIR